MRTARPGRAAGDADRVPLRGLRRGLAAFGSRSYAMFFTAGFFSNLGRWTQDVVIPYVVYQLTSSAAMVGLAAFLRFLPAVAVGPVAGALADRVDRRRVLLVTQLCLGAIAAALWLLFTAQLGTVTVLLAINGITGIVVGINMPAWHALIPQLVPREHLLGAIALNAGQMNGAKAVGPAIAGVILATLGVGWAFAFTAAAYGAVIVALLRVRPRPFARPDHAPGIIADFARTVVRIVRDPTLATCAAITAGVAMLGMPLFQLTPVFATDVFGVGPGAFGVLAGALGLGGAISAPVLSGWTAGITRSGLIGGSMLAYGLFLVAFAQSPTYGVGVVAMVAVGAGFLFTMSTVGTVIQLVVGDEVRGRIVAVYGTVFAAAYPVGSLTQGWIADHIGAPATVTVAGAILAAGAGALLLAGGVRRRLDEEPRPRAEAEAIGPPELLPE